MKAAIVAAAHEAPVLGTFDAPQAREGLWLVDMGAAALSPFSKARSMGAHYSGRAAFPAVAGAEGVGTTREGRRVYLASPEAPYGTLSEQCLVAPAHCVDVPEGLDDVTAAAVANPGMSSWAALVERAALRRGETVLVNGATGSAGRMAVLLARHLGAGKIIATGRDAHALETLRALGADLVIPFPPDTADAADAHALEATLAEVFAAGVDVVIDYLWGPSANALLAAAARHGEEGRAVRFVQVGTAAGTETIALPGAALRAAPIQLMGSGIGSVPLSRLRDAVGQVFRIALETDFALPTRVMSLADIGAAWQAPGTPRVVVSLR